MALFDGICIDFSKNKIFWIDFILVMFIFYMKYFLQEWVSSSTKNNLFMALHVVMFSLVSQITLWINNNGMFKSILWQNKEKNFENKIILNLMMWEQGWILINIELNWNQQTFASFHHCIQWIMWVEKSTS